MSQETFEPQFEPQDERQAQAATEPSISPLFSSGALEDKLAQLPDAPGVYLHKNAEGKVIYTGKARMRQFLAWPEC